MFIRHSIIALSLLMLTACGSGAVNFVRPADTQITLGETTRADIITIMKRPVGSTGKRLVNNTMVDVLEYGYLVLAPELTDSPTVGGYAAVRTQLFYLKNDILVGTEFYSTFAEDSTRFDTAKVTSIMKGKSTRQDVIQLLGNPSMRFIKPLVSDKAASAVGYHYRTMNLANPRDLKTTAAKLVVEFDKNGTVIDVNFESQSNQT